MTNKNILIGVILLIVVVLLGAVYIYGKKTPAPKTAVIDVGQEKNDLALYKYDIPLPKSKVPLAYYNSFNRTINEIALLDSTNREEVYPLVVKVKEGLDKKEYDGLIPLSNQIQNLNETQKKRQAIATAYLNDLTVANDKITDEKTKELTVDFISAGRKVNNAYIAYSALIDSVIAGNVTQQTVADTQTAINNMKASITDFQSATKKLMDYFAEVIKNDIKNATIVPVPIPATK